MTRRFAVCLASLIGIVLCSQVLLRFENVRRLLNESIRLEGSPLVRTIEGLGEPAYPWLDWEPGAASRGAADPGAVSPDSASGTGTVYVRLLRDPPGEVWVLVNGRVVRAMDRDGAAVQVGDGDRVEVFCRQGLVTVMVSTASANLESPAVGTWAEGSGKVFVCQAELK